MLVNPVPQQDLSAGHGFVNNQMAKAGIWAFYNSNPDRVLVKVGGFVKIRVKHLRVLFELLAGPEPL